MSMSRKKEKAAAQKKETTRQLIGINDISDYGLKTSRGMLAFFSVKPTNLSVQPPEAGGRTDLCPDDCPQGPDGDRDAGPQL